MIMNVTVEAIIATPRHNALILMEVSNATVIRVGGEMARPVQVTNIMMFLYSL